MVLSLFAAGADILGGVVADIVGPVQMLVGAGIAAAGTAGILWLAVSPVRSVDISLNDRESSVKNLD